MLTLHSDRGAPMTSKCTAQLLADLGVTRSLSRPQVSDDNPFSEAQFKTLKYHPGFPGRFEDITAAIAFCRSFFPWYNTEHRHAGIAMLTPDDVHHHRAPDVLAQRGRTLQAAWGPSPRTLRPRHPETRPASRSRLDQPTRHFHNRRNESVNRNRRCLKVVDRFRTDQKALFLWGQSGTGKGVFAETLRHVMGEYGTVLAGDRIAGREQGHRQWVVGLQGRRLVLINELPERGRWHTADLNAIIEGGPIEGNSMRQNSVTFESQASVLIVGNHRPRASAASGIWRRLVQVEFRNKPASPDTRLLEKLKLEAPGILAWMIEGSARLQQRGPPARSPEAD